MQNHLELGKVPEVEAVVGSISSSVGHTVTPTALSIKAVCICVLLSGRMYVCFVLVVLTGTAGKLVST